SSHGIYDAAARLGYAWDRWLWYVKGGYAESRVDHSFLISPPAAVVAQSSGNRATGFVAGVGLEYALTDHLIGGIEYDYYGMNVRDSTVTDIVTVCPGVAALPACTSTFSGGRHDVQTITARLSFFWGPPAYAPAPMYTK